MKKESHQEITESIAKAAEMLILREDQAQDPNQSRESQLKEVFHKVPRRSSQDHVLVQEIVQVQNGESKKVQDLKKLQTLKMKKLMITFRDQAHI